MSAPQERKLGESVMREIRSSGAYLNDPEVNGYLNELGNRLVTAIPGAPFDFEFFAVADPAINAFALPGGFVGVNTGLILLTQTESELASVLGHEISHVTQHHIARSIGNQRDAMLLTIAALAAAVLASRVPSSSSGDLTQAAIAARKAWRSRARSTSRARTSRRPTASASSGLMPRASTTRDGDFHGRLQRAATWFEGNSPSYLHDHPVTYRAHRRSAGARVHQAVPPGPRFARLPHGACAAEELRGHAPRCGPFLR